MVWDQQMHAWGIGTDTVNAWMVDQKEAGKYISGRPKNDEDWLANADASGLLHDLFNELTDAKVEFRKTEHSVALAKWILANDPEYLDELYSFLRSLVSA